MIRIAGIDDHDRPEFAGCHTGPGPDGLTNPLWRHRQLGAAGPSMRVCVVGGLAAVGSPTRVWLFDLTTAVGVNNVSRDVTNWHYEALP
jgi:hypothetical protein